MVPQYEQWKHERAKMYEVFVIVRLDSESTLVHTHAEQYSFVPTLVAVIFE
jgi:hypothetical protein